MKPTLSLLEQYRISQEATNPISNNNQTPIFYGLDVQNHIGSLLREHNAKKILLLSGSPEWNRMQWYQELIDSIQREAISFVVLEWSSMHAELDAIESAINLCKKEQVDYILAVGGDNVIDSAKAIAVGAIGETVVWPYFTTEIQPEAALPVSVFLTIPGSDLQCDDKVTVVNYDTLLRQSCRSQVFVPQFYFINPQAFYTISEKELAHIVVLILERMICSYLLFVREHQEEQCKQQEQQIQAFIQHAHKLQRNRFDDVAWQEVLLMSNTVNSLEETACLEMAASLSVMYNVPHGAVAAVLLPAWMRYICNEHKKDFLTFAQKIMQVPQNGSVEEQIEKAIEKIEQFFESFALENNLCALGIQEFCLKAAAQDCTSYSWKDERPLGVLQKLYWKDIVQIYQSVLFEKRQEVELP